ncbi:hypothetical protein BCR39DRAFT_591519 [Naematelia encephala]|uniref:Ubiquitin-like protease family profile domain-containing protein n=1 Tax=Naematelia encephala TaxID=71784 RepID=A0A1Y2AGF8_9TREE|nr:hypothetical protein BCR39DRAFT_591519 [Naematelia encephala]
MQALLAATSSADLAQLVCYQLPGDTLDTSQMQMLPSSQRRLRSSQSVPPPSDMLHETRVEFGERLKVHNPKVKSRNELNCRVEGSAPKKQKSTIQSGRNDEHPLDEIRTVGVLRRMRRASRIPEQANTIESAVRPEEEEEEEEKEEEEEEEEEEIGDEPKKGEADEEEEKEMKANDDEEEKDPSAIRLTSEQRHHDLTINKQWVKTQAKLANIRKANLQQTSRTSTPFTPVTMDLATSIPQQMAEFVHLAITNMPASVLESCKNLMIVLRMVETHDPQFQILYNRLQSHIPVIYDFTNTYLFRPILISPVGDIDRTQLWEQISQAAEENRSKLRNKAVLRSIPGCRDSEGASRHFYLVTDNCFKQSLARLTDEGKWYNDLVMRLLSLTLASELALKRIRGVYVIDQPLPSMPTTWEAANPPKKVQAFQQSLIKHMTGKDLFSNLGGNETIIGYMHLNGNHWACWVIDQKKKQVLVMDSMGVSKDFVKKANWNPKLPLQDCADAYPLRCSKALSTTF